MPTHGWQDTDLTGESKTKGTVAFPTDIEDIIDHYVNILLHAKEIERQSRQDVFVAFCMHPWAIKKYDPEVEVLKGIVDFATANKMKCEPYRAVLDSPSLK